MQAQHRKTSLTTLRNYSKISVSRSSVPTHTRHNKPSLLCIFVIAGLYSALASAPVAAQLNLLYIGVGYCQDSSRNSYDFVRIDALVDSYGNPLNGTALLDFCNSWCYQNPNQLVGVQTYEGSSSICYCRFSDPLPTGLTTESYGPTGTLSYNRYTGVGEVKSSDGWIGATCYSVQNIVATPAPTSIPTAMPTATATSIPTAKLTEEPTPTPTSTPTKSPTDNPTNQPTRTFQGISGKSIAAPNCTINIEGPELTCTSTINPGDIFAGAALFMSMIQGSCEAVTEASTGQSSATSAIQVTAECKNGGFCTSEHCVRIDIKAQDVSLLAAMFKIDSTMLFDTDGAFSANVQTEAFTSTDKTASVAVSRTLSATLGKCGSSEAPTRLNVGDVAYMCIFSQDDIKINLTNVFANPGEQALVTDGMANFLTSFENEANPVTLSTLMIPVFYDLHAGNAGSVTINGTASIIYSRRLESGRFLKDDEEGKFLIEIPLAERSVPVIVHSVAEENAGRVLGLCRVVRAGIAVILGMMFQ